MFYIKQLVQVFVVLGMMSLSLVHAGEAKINVSPLTITDQFKFTAVLDGEGVKMKWNRFDSFSDEFLQYYKIVRSSTNAKPVYPDDGHIKYSSDVGFINFTDSSPKSGTHYYRICAITDKNNRYCSNVVTLNITKSTPEVIKPVQKEVKKDDGINKKIDSLIVKFEAKLDELFGVDTTKKTSAIYTTINKLEMLKNSKPNMASTIDLIIEKLKNILGKTDYKDVEDILNLK